MPDLDNSRPYRFPIHCFLRRVILGLAWIVIRHWTFLGIQIRHLFFHESKENCHQLAAYNVTITQGLGLKSFKLEYGTILRGNCA